MEMNGFPYDVFLGQRSSVWNRSRASRLLESLVIQCPIPVIYLNQEQDEKLSVIDGNQRLRSIQLFLDDEYALRGLTTYPELEGYSHVIRHHGRACWRTA